MKFAIFILLYEPEWDSVTDRLIEYSKNFEKMIIVDNSHQIHKERITAILPEALYYWQGGNKGISKALQYAFQWAGDNDIDYLLTMDQDSEYKKEEIQNMLMYILENQDEKVGIYGANYQKLYFEPKLNSYITDKLAIERGEVKQVEFCMTSGSFINVKAVQGALPLDDFFVSYVDVDLCAWLQENGYILLRVGNSIFQQQVGEKVERSWYNSFFHVLHHKEIRYYFMVRNNLLFRSKYSRFHKMATKRLFRILFNILVGERGKMRKVHACYLGYLDYKRNVYGNIPVKVEKRINKKR